MSDIDRIVTSSPVNRTAGVVTSSGFQYEPACMVLTADQPDPIPTRNIARRKVGSPDFTGMRRGRLTVIGLARDVPKRWVVRCDCSMYTLRTAKAIKNANNDDACQQCRHVERLKRRSEWLGTKEGKAHRRHR